MVNNDINIRIANWHTDKEQLSTIRRLVFIEEQNVPEELEWDEDDASATHFLVTHDRDAMTDEMIAHDLIAHDVIAAARLKPDGQIGRMAVLAKYRNHGIGSKLLRFVLQTAAQKNYQDIYLHAQTSAIPFYEKHGFETQGELFYEADIPHRTMRLNIC